MIRKLNAGLGIPAEILIREPVKVLPDSLLQRCIQEGCLKVSLMAL